MYNKAKTLIKKDTYINFYNKRELLYLETNALGIGFGVVLLKVRDRMNSPSYTSPDNIIMRPIAFTSESFIKL